MNHYRPFHYKPAKTIRLQVPPHPIHFCAIHLNHQQTLPAAAPDA